MGADLFILDGVGAISDDDVAAMYIALCHEDILPAPAVGRLATFLNEVERLYPAPVDGGSVWASYPHLISPTSAILHFSRVWSGDALSVVRSKALELGFIVYEPSAPQVYRPR
jgi:hypothetical protein